MAALRRMGLLMKDESGLQRISPRYYDLVRIGRAFFINIAPKKSVKASSFSRFERSYRPNLVASLGDDCSGPNTTPTSDQLLEDLDKTPSPHGGKR